MCCFGTGRSIAAFDSFDGTLLIVGGTIGVQKIQAVSFKMNQSGDKMAYEEDIID